MLFQFFVKVKKKSMFTKTPYQIKTVHSRDTGSNCTKLALGRLAQNWVHNQSFTCWMQSQFLSIPTVVQFSRWRVQPLVSSTDLADTTCWWTQPVVELGRWSKRPGTALCKRLFRLTTEVPWLIRTVYELARADFFIKFSPIGRNSTFKFVIHPAYVSRPVIGFEILLRACYWMKGRSLSAIGQF